MELFSASGVSQAIEEIKKGKISSAYLVFGDDAFLINDTVQKLLDGLIPEKERSFNLEVFNQDEEDWDRIIQSLFTFGWFGTRRIVVVKNSDVFLSKTTLDEIVGKSITEFERGNHESAMKAFRKALGFCRFKKINEITENDMIKQFPGCDREGDVKKWALLMLKECRDQRLDPIPYEENADKLHKAFRPENPAEKGIPENNTLVLGVEHVDRRKRLYKLIEDIGVIINISARGTEKDSAKIKIEEERVLQEVAEEVFKESGKSLSKGALDLVLSRTGYNVGMFKNEIEKVLSGVDKEKIEATDIDWMIERSKEDSIFDLQEAVAQKDFKKARFFVKELLEQGDFHLVLFQSVVGQIRRLIAAKEFISNDIKKFWNPKMNFEDFKKRIYFTHVLKKKREFEEKAKEAAKGDKKKARSRLNIFGLPADVLLELLKNSDRFTMDELIGAMKILAETDLKMKTLRVPPVLLMEEALFQICKA